MRCFFGVFGSRNGPCVERIFLSLSLSLRFTITYSRSFLGICSCSHNFMLCRTMVVFNITQGLITDGAKGVLCTLHRVPFFAGRPRFTTSFPYSIFQKALYSRGVHISFFFYLIHSPPPLALAWDTPRIKTWYVLRKPYRSPRGGSLFFFCFFSPEKKETSGASP